jgi:exopolysaccharide biosynthesis polyprenyl glycosylphosphotransferase
MFTYRLRGLLNLYILTTMGLAAGFFVSFAAVTHYVPWLTLSPTVNLTLCVAVIAVGMGASGRFLTAISWKFHEMGWPDAAWLATRQIIFVALALFAMMVATKDHSLSRIFLAAYLVLGWVLLVLVNRSLPRYLADLAFSRMHRLPTLFVGHGRNLHRLNDWVAQKRHLGIVPVGFLSEDSATQGHEAIGRFLGAPVELARTIDELKVAQVILINLPANQDEIRGILLTCQEAGCRLLIYDNIAERLPVPMLPVLEEGQFFFTMQAEPLEDPLNRGIKRAFDIMVALPVVALLLPVLCLVVWTMQRWQSPGPVFFLRPRGGRMRTEFEMLKFRSMRHETNPDAAREAIQARHGDERVYPFGRFLRRTSLDEFPQFWNVLIGDMSVVGPRPHLPRHDYEFSQLASLYRTRHLVKPGITGLAQIEGFRGEITDPKLLQRRVELDIFYITHWSIWFDLQITLKTFKQLLFPARTAY